MTTPQDPTAPPKFWGRDGQGNGYRAATVCKRRHEQSTYGETYPGSDLDFCPVCGADVLSACPSCGRRLRGLSRLSTARGAMPTYGRHQWGFCDGCGESYPWATRQELIYKLQNLLDTADISDHDRLMVAEDLQRLQELDESDDSKDERGKLWSAIKRRAPGLFVGPGLQIATKVAGDLIVQQLK